jgi:hypothetical protein
MPVGKIFSAPVQTGPMAHPAFSTMGTESFPGVKRPGRGGDHPHQSSAEVEGRVELYIYSPSGPSWPVLGLPLPLLQSRTCRELKSRLISYDKLKPCPFGIFPLLR